MNSILSEREQLHELWVNNEPDGVRLEEHGAALSGANIHYANLTKADLGGADLSGANLRGANLSKANLSKANLTKADLSGANLRGANLTGANLTKADLTGAIIPWQSHDVVAEILQRNAETIKQQALASLILVYRHRCWAQWRTPGSLGDLESEREWALGVLCGYVQDGDGAPDDLR